MFPKTAKSREKKCKTANNQKKKSYRAASEPPGEVAREWRLLLAASAVDLQLGRRKNLKKNLKLGRRKISQSAKTTP